jgi:orotate phosphoribosyltransferase
VLGVSDTLAMHEDVVRLLRSRRGHFRLESGHHGDTWLDVEVLCLRPMFVKPLAAELAERLRRHGVQMICGPLIEGAFVALFVASVLDLPFTYTEPSAGREGRELYPVDYRLPQVLRGEVSGRRVAIVNDVINAGSAVRGTHADLQACDARVVAIAALATLGHAASDFARHVGVSLETIAALPNQIWSPVDCPLCASGLPLEGVGA